MEASASRIGGGASVTNSIIPTPDPDNFADQLPQPFRFIWKIIDEEILDPVWLTLTRLHTDLLQGENGEPLFLQPNRNLQIVCTPSSVIEQSAEVVSIMEVQNVLFQTTSAGALVAVDPTNGSMIRILQLLPSSTATIAVDTSAAPPPKPTIPQMWISGVSGLVSTERVFRLGVCSVFEVEEEIKVVDVGGKKAPPPKKATEQEPLTKVAKCRVSVIEVKLGSKENTPSNYGSLKIKLIHDIYVTIAKAERVAVRNVDISLEADLLSVSTSGGVSLYRLAPIVGLNSRPSNLENIAEIADDDADEAIHRANAAVPLVSSCLLDVSTFFLNKQIKSAFLFNLLPAKSMSSTSSKSTSSFESGSAFHQTGLAVIFEESPEWSIVGFNFSTPPVSTPAAVVTAGSGVGAAAAVVAAPLSTNVQLADAIKLCQWRLSATVSVIEVDECRSVLIFGLRDGSVSIWNLTSRTLTATIARHETAVSSICLFQAGTGKSGFNGSRSGSFYLLSGALDGTLCFFSVVLPNKEEGQSPQRDYSFVEVSSSGGASAPCLSASFNSFRRDVSAGTSIISIRSLKDIPIAIVQCSNGLSIVYDVQAGALLGKLALYSGMTSQQVSWRIVTMDLLKSNSPILQLENLDEASVAKLKDNKIVFEAEKRATKYAFQVQSDLSLLTKLNSIAAASYAGYHCLYLRNEQPVLATFGLEELFMILFPGLSAVMRSNGGQMNQNLLQLFAKLTPAERMSDSLAIARMSSFESFGVITLGDGVDLRSIKEKEREKRDKTKPSSGVPNLRESRGTKGVVSAGMGGTPFEVSFSSEALGLISFEPESISKSSWERVCDPSVVANRSAAKSLLDRNMRKQRLHGALSQIASSF